MEREAGATLERANRPRVESCDTADPHEKFSSPDINSGLRSGNCLIQV